MYVFLFVILDDEFIRLCLLCLINKVMQTFALLRQFSHLLCLTAGAVTVIKVIKCWFEKASTSDGLRASNSVLC